MKSCHGAAVKSGAAWPGFKNWNLLKKSQEQHVTLSRNALVGLADEDLTFTNPQALPAPYSSL